MATSGFCPECDAYGEFERLGEYRHKCQGCFETVDARDIPHAVVPKQEWCGQDTCPKCQGHTHGPYEEPARSDGSLNELPEEIKTLKADSRGRINLGTEYADAEVRVAVLEVEE